MDITKLIDTGRKAVKHEHHYLFLLACVDGSVVPRGLAVKKPVCVHSVSTEFSESWLDVENETGEKFRNLLLIEHQNRTRRYQLQFWSAIIKRMEEENIWTVREDFLWILEAINMKTNELSIRRTRKLLGLMPNFRPCKYEHFTSFILDILSVSNILFGEVSIYYNIEPGQGEYSDSEETYSSFLTDVADDCNLQSGANTSILSTNIDVSTPDVSQSDISGHTYSFVRREEMSPSLRSPISSSCLLDRTLDGESRGEKEGPGVIRAGLEGGDLVEVVTLSKSDGACSVDMNEDKVEGDFSAVYNDIFQPNSQLDILMEEDVEGEMVGRSSQELRPWDENGVIILGAGGNITEREILGEEQEVTREGGNVSLNEPGVTGGINENSETNFNVAADRLTGSFVSQNVINLSKRVLSEDEISLLSKGLKFCPTPRDLDRGKIKTDLEQFGRRLRLRWFFREEERGFETNPFRPKSTFSPPKDDVAIEVYLSRVEEEILSISEHGKNYSNLTEPEQEALRNLKEDDSIIIKQADKGSGVVVWDRDDYLKEADNHLLNETAYRECGTDPTSKLLETITACLSNIRERGDIDEQTLDYFMVNNPRMGRFYLLPKIHKRLSNVPGRPVVSNCSYYTENIANFLDYHIQPLSKKVKSYIKDTNDFLRKIKSLPPLPEGAILCTIDVIGLYPNIPHEYGLAALRKALDTREDQSVSTDSLIELAELSLKNNYFEHNSRIFQQMQGTAIGAKYAPPYAIVSLDEFETEAIENYHLKPWVWWRYIDDVFLIWQHGEESLLEFLQYLNTLHPTIKFDSPAQYSTESLDFLDVTVSRIGNTLKTDLYSKPTDTHQFLEFSSCHPFHTKRSIPYSQTLRLRRICSEDKDFYQRVRELKGYLRARGYDMKMVEKQVLEAMKISRDEALAERENREDKNDRDVFVTTYHPALSEKLNKIFKNAHPVLTRREDHLNLFPNVPMISYRRTKSLQDILVRAMVKNVKNEPNICRGCEGRSDCEVCGVLKKGAHFTNKSKTRTFDIRKGTLHCNTDLCIYLMTCNICEKQYVGKSKPKFRIRYNNYKSKFRKYYFAKKEGTLKDLDEPIPQAHLFEHFANHIGDDFIDENGQEDFSFWSFQLIDKSPDEEKLEERENFWIYKLGTMTEMGGLNVQDVPVGSKKQRKQNEKQVSVNARGRGRGRGRPKTVKAKAQGTGDGSNDNAQVLGERNLVVRGKGKATRGRGRGSRGRK